MQFPSISPKLFWTGHQFFFSRPNFGCGAKRKKKCCWSGLKRFLQDQNDLGEPK